VTVVVGVLVAKQRAEPVLADVGKPVAIEVLACVGRPERVHPVRALPPVRDAVTVGVRACG
jgi:hypothetical protein